MHKIITPTNKKRNIFPPRHQDIDIPADMSSPGSLTKKVWDELNDVYYGRSDDASGVKGWSVLV